MQSSALCRSRRELSNAYFLARFGFDASENEPCQVEPPAEPLAAHRGARRTPGAFETKCNKFFTHFSKFSLLILYISLHIEKCSNINLICKDTAENGPDVAKTLEQLLFRIILARGGGGAAPFAFAWEAAASLGAPPSLGAARARRATGRRSRGRHSGAFTYDPGGGRGIGY